MEILVLGAGPSYTDRKGAASSSYLVTAGSDHLLLDLGQGAFTNLARAIEPSVLGAVLISHLHPDHFVDLVPLRHYLRYQLAPARRVRVLGPRGLGPRLDALIGERGHTAAALDIEDLSVGGRRVGPFEVEAALVRHTDESYAFRISVGGSASHGLVYSGDCGRADDLLPLIRPGDTLLAEASFGPGPVPSGAEHLDAPAVGRIATVAGAGRLMLTHLGMGIDPDATLEAARACFSGDLRLVFESDQFNA